VLAVGGVAIATGAGSLTAVVARGAAPGALETVLGRCRTAGVEVVAAGAARETRWQGLWVVPSTPRLVEIDRGALAGERVLWARMASDYDYVLMDCGASPGVVLGNALTAADEILAPVQAKGMALGGLARLEKLIERLNARTQRDARRTGILVCLFDSRTRISRLVLARLRARYRGLVFDTLIHENVRLAEAADRRRPISWYDADSRGAAEYAALAFEVAGRERRRMARERREAVAGGHAPLGAARSGTFAGTARVGAHHTTPFTGPASRN